MIHLTPDEARILGVLIEKAMTTPEQYPLTQNAVMNGANQKNNRDPVIVMDDNRAFDALEGLRGKNLLVRVTQAGSRVDKFRHLAGETLHARPGRTGCPGGTDVARPANPRRAARQGVTHAAV